MRILYPLFVFVFWVHLFSQTNALAQTAAKRGIELEFTEKKTIQASNELASNVVRIKNNSSREVSFNINISAPDGWKQIFSRASRYTLSPQDSIFIPVNLTPQKSNGGRVNHVINAFLTDENGTQFASAIWYMSIKQESNWSISALSTKVFFLNGSDSAHFALRLQNQGNAEEKIKLSFLTDKRIKVLDPANPFGKLEYYNLRLPANRDTIITFTASRTKQLQTTLREDVGNYSGTVPNDVLPVKITAQNETEDNTTTKVWRGTVDFVKATAEAQLREHQSASLPLTVEATIDNIMDNSTILNLSLYGNAMFDKGRSLNYRFQTFFFDNFFHYQPFFGNSHYVGYTSPKTSLEVGDINGNATLGYNNSGKGVKASQEVVKNNILSAFYVQAPTLFNSTNRSSYGAGHTIRLGRNSIETQVQMTDDALMKFTSTQYSNRIGLNILKFHNIVLNSVYSNESYTGGAEPINKTGYAYYALYAGTFKKINISISNSFGSKSNTGYRGIKTLSAYGSYRFNNKRTLSASYYSSSQNPEYYSPAGILFNSIFNANEQYELGYNFTTLSYSLSLKLKHIYSEAFNLKSLADAFAVDYRPQPKGDLRFYLSLYGAYNQLPDFDIDPYFTAQIRSSIRYRGLTQTIRYYYGPYQIYDQLLFARTKTNGQSFYTTTNLKFWLLKSKLTFEPNIVYSYETLYKRNRLSLRPELYYLPKRGTEIKFYAQYINNNQKNNPNIIQNPDLERITPSMGFSNLFFGLGIKKALGVPVSGKKYLNLTIEIFKDINGNGRLDKNEKGLKNVLVNIRPVVVDSNASTRLNEVGENFVTNDAGVVVYKNLPKGAYRISINPLSETGGFFAGNEQIVVLEKDLKYPMPLNQGVHLTGILAVERDQTAADLDKRIDVSNIRITAMDSLGKTYSTLTDKDGRFTLRLPVGVYQVSLNESALPDNFELEQKRIIVEMLTVADNYNITFIAREKKRKINIRKFDQQGKLIEKTNNNTKKNEQTN